MGDQQPQARSAAVAAEERRAGARRGQVLAVLRQAPDGLGVRDLARRLGVHENTVRFHLTRLLEEGSVERRTTRGTGAGRPRLAYVASSAMTAAGERNYELLARILAGFVAGTADDPSVAAVAAGEAWGRYRARRPAPYTRTDREASVAQLVELLDDVGFEPELAPAAQEGTQELRLHHCPFLEVARDHGEVACSVHLGLMQGALAEMRAPVAVTTLEPFVAPSVCVARLTDTGRD